MLVSVWVSCCYCCCFGDMEMVILSWLNIWGYFQLLGIFCGTENVADRWPGLHVWDPGFHPKYLIEETTWSLYHISSEIEQVRYEPAANSRQWAQVLAELDCWGGTDGEHKGTEPPSHGLQSPRPLSCLLRAAVPPSILVSEREANGKLMTCTQKDLRLKHMAIHL